MKFATVPWIPSTKSKHFLMGSDALFNWLLYTKLPAKVMIIFIFISLYDPTPTFTDSGPSYFPNYIDLHEKERLVREGFLNLSHVINIVYI